MMTLDASFLLYSALECRAPGGDWFLPGGVLVTRAQQKRIVVRVGERSERSG